MAVCKLKCFRGHFVLKSWHRTENMFPLQMRWICQQIFPATYPLRVLCLSLRRVTVILRLGATSSSCLPSLMDMSIRALTVGYLPENNSSLLHLQTKLDISVVSCQYLCRIYLCFNVNFKWHEPFLLMLVVCWKLVSIFFLKSSLKSEGMSTLWSQDCTVL